MIIWYLNHYAVPKGFGSSRRAHSLGRFFQQKGHTFINFCAAFHHLRKEPAAPETLGQIRSYDNLPYYQVQTCKYRRNDFFRIANMLEYTMRVSRLTGKIQNGKLEKPDIIIPSCAHIFSYLAASNLRKKVGAKVIYEVRDIWPLSLIQLAGTSRWNPLILWMTHIEKMAYKNADAIVSLLPGALDHMAPMGVDSKCFRYIPNGFWADEWDSKPSQIPPEHKQVFDRCTQNNKLKVVYAGSHGPPNALDQILRLKEVVHQKDLPYHFILIGDGILKAELVAKSQKHNLTYVDFLPKVNQSELAAILGQADVCFLGWQKKDIYKLGISPNKICDYFMAEKPVVHAYDGKNDPVATARAGITIEPNNPQQLDDALMEFNRMPIDQRYTLGRRGKQYALQHLEWGVLGGSYHDLCQMLTLQ
jgi:glycosyltransferase involved in cell wall biosynthesis